jgi:hypothetical protein
MQEVKEKLAIFILVLFIGIGVMMLIPMNMDMTGNTAKKTAKSTEGMITAKGNFGGQMEGQTQLTFPAKGGTATGKFAGSYYAAQQGATISYDGTLSGTYAGGDGGKIQGNLQGKVEAILGNHKYVDPMTGTYTGTVSLSKGTVTGTWTSKRLQGPFSMKFTPVTGAKKASAGQAGAGAAPTGTDKGATGYCRCITGPYEAGAFTNYYGGKGLEFKGFSTLTACMRTCQGKHSWIQIGL